jgi:DNA/RNA-binding domain of Phe-tRNA-synthetase-like protein
MAPGSGPAGDETELYAAAGFVDPDVAEEFPGLRLDWMTAGYRPAKSPPELIDRLRYLANRVRGATVVAMRSQPIPHAYRSFFRQIGLDPDTHRIPSEEAALARLYHGTFRSGGLVADACAIALIETGVPVWALDADLVDVGGPGIRTGRAGERLGRGPAAGHVQPGTLVVADSSSVLGVLFGELSADVQQHDATRRLLLFSVSVAGVPRIHSEEALWLAAEALQTAA